MKKIFRNSFVCLIAVFIAGCSGYEENAQKLRGNWRAGNFGGAAAVAGTALDGSDADDRLLWQLERGATLRALGDAKESSEEFERAAETLARWEETPDVLLSREALAELTNLSALPYRGRGSDIIMLHTYRALCFLETGDSAAARAALNAAYQAQRDAVERNAENIENAKKEAEKSAVDVTALLKQTGLDKQSEDRENDSPEIRAYADYVNPFTTWLHGIYFLHAGTDASDTERARISLSRAAAMYPKNPYVAEDAEAAARGVPAQEALTYVVFESGLAPIIGSARTDLMLPIPTGRGYLTPTPVSIALPKLVFSGEKKYWGVFPIVSGSYSVGDAAARPVPALAANGVPAQEICDMNSVVRTDFDNAYPAILARTLTTAFLKSAAAAAVNAVGIEYARRDGGAGAAIVSVATIVGSSIYAYASSGADVRCWQTLPQNFSIVRMKTPSARRITVEVGGRSREVDLAPGRVNLVHVKTTNAPGPIVISQSVLK